MKNPLRTCLFFLIYLCACNSIPGDLSLPRIDRHPPAFAWRIYPIQIIPHYVREFADAPYDQIDLRSVDLSSVDARKRESDLMFADFDTRTIWPPADKLPSGFDWKEIMELGKDPGLGIHSLQAEGITGQGASIAMIDLILLVDHQEYKAQLQLYEEVKNRQLLTAHPEANPHGAAVASIAVGKTVGVAPDAKLFYIGLIPSDTYLIDYAKAVERIVAINRQLPIDQKIRVLSISNGWDSEKPGYERMEIAVQEAKKEGIFVISSSISTTYSGFSLNGLGRYPLADPNLFESYEPGLWWEKLYYNNDTVYVSRLKGSILIPMDSRTTASSAGVEDYAFYRSGGWSWSIPYLAGVYALAVQVDAQITPEKFWDVALRTGKYTQIEHEGKIYKFGPILNPVDLIHALQGT